MNKGSIKQGFYHLAATFKVQHDRPLVGKCATKRNPEVNSILTIQ